MRGRDGNILPAPPPPLPIVPRWVINTGPSPPQYSASSLKHNTVHHNNNMEYLSTIIPFHFWNTNTFPLVINTGPSPPQYCASSMEYLWTTLCITVEILLQIPKCWASKLKLNSSLGLQHRAFSITILCTVRKKWISFKNPIISSSLLVVASGY